MQIYRLNSEYKADLIKLLKEYVDRFAWSYSGMPGLSRDLVDHQLPIKAGFRPYKQPARHFNPAMYDRIKEEINRLLNVCILFAASVLILKTGLFPRWTAWLGFVIAVYNLSFVPTIFFMTTPLDFYSVNGWNIPIAAGWFFLWILIIGIFLIRKRKAI